MELSSKRENLTLFLCGDVMTGRGIDQIMSRPCDPQLYESYVRDARQYAALAEALNGRIDYPVNGAYIWGDALTELEAVQPDLRLINLETSITTSSSPWSGKGIHYRMHPANIDCLTAAGIDACALANNHILDWGYDGLNETLEALGSAPIACAGAGRNRSEAQRPAVLELEQLQKVIFLSCALPSSGTPGTWAARDGRAGVFWLPDLCDRALETIATALEPYQKGDDTIICSIHWGGNWGYDIAPEQRAFAHRLIDEVGVDIIHGHSSHHPQTIEVHEGKVIFYGCGDFINDYEGIRGHEEYRGDLTLMYFLELSSKSKQLQRLRMVPMQLYRFQLRYAAPADSFWLSKTLSEMTCGFGNPCTVESERCLLLNW